VAVMLDVLLGGFCSVVSGVMKMALRGVSVVGGGLVIAGFVMHGSFAMMTSCVFVVFSCFGVMFRRLLRHLSSLNIRHLNLPRG
jgi:hypothetical protein